MFSICYTNINFDLSLKNLTARGLRYGLQIARIIYCTGYISVKSTPAMLLSHTSFKVQFFNQNLGAVN